MTRKIRRYGWQPDLPDLRDEYFRVPLLSRYGFRLASGIDLRPKMPSVYDQGELGSCTGNAIAGAVQYERARQHLSDYVPSRLFIYYGERAIEGTTDQDSGAQLRDGIKVIATLGACSESIWPYDISKFAVKPPAQAYSQALQDIAVTYQRVDNTNVANLKFALSQGFPIVFGFSVYESFESKETAKTGNVTMPGPNEAVIGGHAVVCVGYKNDGRFIVRNSWGPSWGDHGYFYMPAEYIGSSDLATDFWVINLIKGQ